MIGLGTAAAEKGYRVKFTLATKLVNAETWAAQPADRCFIGYFPVDRLRLAADVVWTEYHRETEGASGGA